MMLNKASVTMGHYYCYILMLILLPFSTRTSPVSRTSPVIAESVPRIVHENVYENVSSNSGECPAYCSCLGTFADCSKEDIISIPNIPNWVLQLDLSSQKIFKNSTITFVIAPSLLKLKLNDSTLEFMPLLSGLTSLRTLLLSHNHIREINSKSLEMLPQLWRLNLNFNSIEIIKSENFPNDNNITVLHINNNKIKSLVDGAFDNMKKLEDLKLNNNKLHSLPPRLFESLKQLTSLELNGNKLRSIEYVSFQGLDNLTILKLSHNNIKTIQNGAFVGLKSINTLQLEHNEITTVSKGWMYGLQSLTYMILSWNSISELEFDCWEPSVKLEELDLSNNKLYYVDGHTFEHLDNLKVLKLDRNRISAITEEAFGHTPHLEILQLSNNEISWTVEDMSGPFNKLRNLQKFTLTSNHIKSINSKAFEGLSKLIYLDLNGNNITSIHSHAFDSLVNLREFHMNSSSLLCDCNLQWITNWMRKTIDSKFVTATCAYPTALRDVHISHLKSKNFTCNDSPKPIIVESPKTQLVIKGATAHLRCVAMSSSTSKMTFVWKKNNEKISNPVVKESVSQTESGQGRALSELLIPNITHSASGRYQCIVSNSLGTTYSNKARLNIVIFPKFIKTPSNMTVKAGDTVNLPCAAIGEPSPEISWKKDGGNDFPAARERRMHVMTADHVFFIINAKTSDMGIYSCTARNPAGTIVFNASLNVLEAPSFVKVMENKEVTSGESVVLQCMISGSPKPHLKWLKDGSPIVPAERHFFTAEDQLLIIVNAESSDEGHYQCEITNSLGTERGSTDLRVLPPISIIVNEEDMTGIIIITVVCCAVGTSIVWVVIIYQTRKRMNSALPNFTSDSLNMVPLGVETDPSPQLFSDNVSERSSCKDSGTGDSGKQNSFDGVPNEESEQLKFEPIINNSYSPVTEGHRLLPSSFKPSVKVCVNSSTTPASYSFSSHSKKDSCIRCTDDTHLSNT